MLRLLTTDPLLLGRPFHVYLGLILLFLVSFQLLTGRAVYKGRVKWLPYHRRNPLLIIAIGGVHVYLAVGVWFLGFTYGR